MWLNVDFSFSEHVHKTCKVCSLQMCDLHQIKNYFTHEVTFLASSAIVGSRLECSDVCWSTNFFVGTPQANLL